MNSRSPLTDQAHSRSTFVLDRHDATGTRPVRILHVFSRLAFGGAEMRTIEVMGAIDRQRFQLDFCCLSGLSGPLDEQVRELGGSVHLCRLGLDFPARFRRLLRDGRYDVVHAHSHYTSGLILRLAAQARIPVRIAHFRVTVDGRPNTVRRQLQRALMRRWIDRHATRILAVSEGTMAEAWGADWSEDPRCQVVYNGLDLRRFAQPADPAGVRQEFGLPDGCPLYLHVGRMDPQKNHDALPGIFQEIHRHQPDARLLLVGRTDADIERRLRDRLGIAGLADSVVLAGARTDVPRLLQAADLLLLPSLWEGLPGVVLEACAASTPVLATDLPGVREIATWFPTVCAEPLAPGEESAWGAAAVALARRRVPPAWETVQHRFADSPFDLDQCAAALCRVWEGRPAR